MIDVTAIPVNRASNANFAPLVNERFVCLVGLFIVFLPFSFRRIAPESFCFVPVQVRQNFLSGMSSNDGCQPNLNFEAHRSKDRQSVSFHVRLYESQPGKGTARLPFWLAARPLGDDHLTVTFPVTRVPENVAGLPNKSN